MKKEDCNLAALGQRFLHGHICSDPLKKTGKTPGNKSHTADQLTLSPFPDKGWGISTQAKMPEKLSSRPLPQKTDWKNR